MGGDRNKVHLTARGVDRWPEQSGRVAHMLIERIAAAL